MPISLINAASQGGAPACKVYNSGNFSVANGTFTKVPYNTRDFDTASAFDTTNNRFLPLIAGYYQVTARATAGSVSTTGQSAGSIYKNGSEYLRGLQIANSANASICPMISALVYLNGSTDYVEFFAYQSTGGSVTFLGGYSAESYFEAAFVRSA